MKKVKGPRRTIQVWGIQTDNGTKVDAGDSYEGQKIVSVYNLSNKDGGPGYRMVFSDNTSVSVEANVVLANPRFN
jgi:hypothetical protein